MAHSMPAESETHQTEDAEMEQEPVATGDAHRTSEEDVEMAEAAPKPSASMDDIKEDEEEKKKGDIKLEDLFADDDDDEEFPSSRPAARTPSSSPGEMTPTSR